MKSVILYFGSFNPIHSGHLAVAEYVLHKGLASELWFVVSPQNPLKDKDLLVSEQHRLAMVQRAINGSSYSSQMKACDVEFSLPKPSYTIDTLRVLTEQYPQTTFSLLLGGDILGQFHKWKEYKEILANYKIYAYPRRGYSGGDIDLTLLDNAPYFDYSSTEIRNALMHNPTDAKQMLPTEVLSYIKEYQLWSCNDWDSLMAQGKANYAAGNFGAALNDFLAAQKLCPDNAEASQYIDMINEILNFRYTDQYNP